MSTRKANVVDGYVVVVCRRERKEKSRRQKQRDLNTFFFPSCLFKATTKIVEASD